MSNAGLATGTQRVAMVTGATGFVGSHLARRLVREGWQVHILSRAGSRLPDKPEFTQITNHVHDGSTEGMVRCIAEAKPDVVFHLASLFLSQHVTKDVEPLIVSNVLFGNQLLEAMKVNEVRYLINTGTSWQHYNNEKYNPVCLYAATKQAFEALLQYYVESGSIKVTTLELFDTYGPDDPRPKLLHLLEKIAVSGEALAMSPGEQMLDIVYIDDVIEAFLLAAKRLQSADSAIEEKYAVSSGKPVTLKDVVASFEEVTGKKLSIQWGGRPYREREVMLPWSLGNKLPGWVAEVSFEEGLRRMRK